MYVRIGVGVVLVGWQLQYLSSRRGEGAGAFLLAEEALKDWAGRTVRDEVAFFSAEETTWGSTIHLSAGRVIEWGLLAVILIDMASGGGRRRLSSCRGCCGWGGNSSHGGHRQGRGPVSSNLLVGFF